MSLRCGIVGLPNVGKSTLFTALTSTKALIANYPFTTIDPHVGVVEVPDPRLYRLADLYHSRRITPTTVEFVDIAGLVKGASKGEGLGNRFLGHIREVDAIVHVLRCFADPEVVHVSGQVDPLRDMEVIQTELVLADLEAMQRRLERVEKKAKSNDPQALKDRVLTQRIIDHLNLGKAARTMTLSVEETEQMVQYQLLTYKPVLYAANVAESEVRGEPAMVKRVRERAKEEGSEVIVISGRIEAELLDLSPSERAEYLKQMGLEETGLARLIRVAYQLLGLITFFTAGETESRAWTVLKGTKAQAAAGKIHTDMERGFIRAEVMSYDDLVSLGSEAAVREGGLLRLEGKDYPIKDGDVIYFRFHV
jgi:GTP-binding protein YchF